jgi:hypothetical protein
MVKVKRISLTLALLVSAMLACDSAPNKPNNRTDHQYDLTGVALANRDQNVSQVAVELMRDSAPLKSAVIRLGADTLRWAKPVFTTDSLHYLLRDQATTLAGKDLNLSVNDSNINTNSFAVSLPDTFSILTVEPPNRIVNGLQSVSVSWSGSGGASGYVLATVRRPFANTGTGYSAFVTSLNTAGTLPPDAFSLSVGPNPDTGWYYIYVYAYTGAIDSSFSHLMLPVPMPDMVANNIDDDPWFGSLGAAVVTRRDSVHVVIQP